MIPCKLGTKLTYDNKNCPSPVKIWHEIGCNGPCYRETLFPDISFHLSLSLYILYLFFMYSNILHEPALIKGILGSIKLSAWNLVVAHVPDGLLWDWSKWIRLSYKTIWLVYKLNPIHDRDFTTPWAILFTKGPTMMNDLTPSLQPSQDDTNFESCRLKCAFSSLFHTLSAIH